MQCEIHKGEIGDILVLLPLPSKNGALETMACVACAEKSEVYCTKHHLPHGYWGQDATRCHACAMEIVDYTMWRVREIILTLRTVSPKDYVELHREKCPPYFTEEQSRRVILYFLASSALAMKIDIDDLLRKIKDESSLDFLKNKARMFI